MKTHLLRCLAVLSLLVPAHAADVTVSDTLVSLASSAGGTKNYTFTDAASGQSVTVAVTMTPYSQTVGEVFTALDGNTRLGIGPGGSGDDNHVDSTEGVNLAASLVSATAGVTASSVRTCGSRRARGGGRPCRLACTWRRSCTRRVCTRVATRRAASRVSTISGRSACLVVSMVTWLGCWSPCGAPTECWASHEPHA